MTQVIMQAVTDDEETVLQDAWIEFNEIAEIEPKFFQTKFKEIFAELSPIVIKNDFANVQIR